MLKEENKIKSNIKRFKHFFTEKKKRIIYILLDLYVRGNGIFPVTKHAD